MDGGGNLWYFSCMVLSGQIPVFNLFGETGAFPDVVHCERIWDRARLHDWVIAPHRHRAMMQIFFMERGRAKVRLDGADYGFSDGDYLFVPPGVVHGFAFRQGCEGLVLSFPSHLAGAQSGGRSDGSGPGRGLLRFWLGRADPSLRQLMAQLVEGFGTSGTFRANLLTALSQALLARVAGEIETGSALAAPPGQRRMADFDRLIQTHITEGWSVGDYASALSVTPGHLNRICRTATGTSAARHIETAVMAEACRLLAFTQLAVAEVGYRLGFADPSYFSRRFRALQQQAPSDYRARFTG